MLCIRRAKVQVCDEIPCVHQFLYDLRFLGSIPVGNYLAKRKGPGPTICITALGGSKAFPVATLTLEMTWDLANRKRGSHHFQAIVRDREISVPEFIGLDRYSFPSSYTTLLFPSQVYISYRVHLRCSNFGVQQDNGIYPRPRNCFQNVKALRSQETKSRATLQAITCFLFFLSQHVSLEISVTQPEIQPVPFALEADLTLRAARESSKFQLCF